MDTAILVIVFIFFALFLIWLIKKCNKVSENIKILSQKAKDWLNNLRKEFRWGSIIITLVETYFSFVQATFEFFRKV